MPLPTPISNLTRWAVRQSAAAVVYLSTNGLLDLLEEDEFIENEDLEWRRLQLLWTRITPTGTQEDVAVTTFDLLNTTGGDIDTTWTSGDYTAVETAFITWWTAVKSHVSSGVTFSQFRFYKKRFPLSLASGPPDHIGNYNSPGTGSAADTLPLQTAMSITEKTPLPRSWGRFYQPGLLAANLDQYGRWTSGEIDAWADATETLYETLISAELAPIVPVSAAQIVVPVQSIQIDDIPDVVRRRRPKTTLIRDARTLT